MRPVFHFVGQLSGEAARGRWICAGCGWPAFPRNAWTAEAVAVIRARRRDAKPDSAYRGALFMQSLGARA